MKQFNKIIFFVCGLLLTFAAFPVFAQENQAPDVKINQRPLQNVVAALNEKIRNGKIDLTEPFSIEVEGALDKSGRLDPKTAKFVKTEGGEKIVDAAKTFVEAVSASGIFGYLKNIGVERINFALAQDGNRVYASVVSELTDTRKAKTFASGLNMVIQLAGAKNAETKGISDEEKILIGGAKVSSADKTLTINFNYEKNVIQELIKRKLNDAAKDK